MRDHELNAESIFGEGIIGHRIFYRYPISLRFELEKGSTHIHRFTESFSRARAIMGDLLVHALDLRVTLLFHSERVRLIARQLRDLEIPIPKQRRLEKVVLEGDEPGRTLTVSIDKISLNSLCFASCGTELGVRPRLSADAFIWSASLGVIAHPYDDRGMDVAATRADLLHELLEKRVDWLLDYDLDEMRNRFPGFIVPSG